MDSKSWYESLNKPSWAPEASIFGRVWSVLYVIIFIVQFYVLTQFLRGKLPFLVALPFWLNLVANLAFSPVQFGLKNNLLSFIVIIAVELTLIWSMIAIWPYSKWVVLAYVPYVLWVTIASALQFEILRLN